MLADAALFCGEKVHAAPIGCDVAWAIVIDFPGAWNVVSRFEIMLSLDTL